MREAPLARGLALAAAVAVLALVALPAAADDVRPVKVLVKELPSGAYDVQWEVPKVVRPEAMPSPLLPEVCRPEGERTFLDRPVAWLSRQVYECPGGLAGQPLGIRFPAYNIGLSTLLRVEMASGERHAHLLSPGEDSWRVPEPAVGGVAAALREGREAVLTGARHFFTSGAHLVLLLVLCLLGGARVGVRLATAFWLAQSGGAALGAILGLGLPAALAEIAVALAAVLLAREALRPPDDRRQMSLVAAGAGVAHGLGLPGLVTAPGAEAEPGVLALLLVALGMDAALLLSIGVIAGLGELVARRAGSRLPTLAAYGLGAAAFAFAFSALLDGPAVSAEETEGRLRLPSMGAGSGGTVLPGSRRLASSTPDAPIQSFLAVEAFEVRHEILVRLKDVATLVDLPPGPDLAVEDQDGVKGRTLDLVRARGALELDGGVPEPLSQRVDFVTLDEKGVLPRPDPVIETIETAWIGVTFVYLTETTARELSLTWQVPEGSPEIPATVTDPETTRSEVLTSKQPVLRWVNELSEDPAPTVTAVAVEPATLTVPLGSLAVLASGLLLAWAGRRHRRRPMLDLAPARVVLALAVLVGPLVTGAVALPWSEGWTPGAREAQGILARILPNVYRSLESRSESAVFDRLALSVTGETLTDVYLDHRAVLQMEERGGARARVEAVEVVEAASVEPTDSGGFSADAVWTVGGTVTHFGHRHFRQNRYDARVEVVPDQGIWKLGSVEILDEQRLR